MSSESIIVVAKRSAYGKFVEEGRDPRVRELLTRSDPSVHRWKKAHDDHHKTLDHVRSVISGLGLKCWFVRGPQKLFDSTSAALVVTVGGDGTLLAASHNVGSVPILGVNSAPNHSIGFFCAARAKTFEHLLDKALSSKQKTTSLTRMQVDVAGHIISRRVLNEALFCHGIPAATSRYILRSGRRREEQRSSGVWVSTAAGSTGALRSAGGKPMALSSKELQVVVREPYLGEDKSYQLTQLLVAEGRSAAIQNKMQDAWLFLDGPFKKSRVALGQTIRFCTSDQPLSVVGIGGRRKRA